MTPFLQQNGDALDTTSEVSVSIEAAGKVPDKEDIPDAFDLADLFAVTPAGEFSRLLDSKCHVLKQQACSKVLIPPPRA